MSRWLGFTLLAIFIQGVFALFEMACVSFNKVRLQYYVSRNNRRAGWLSFLLKRPSRLFGTTLIGINTSLQVGSECARHFYESIHLDPDWAPVTQVLLVVIFGELAPMFAARRHPEQIAMGLIPIMVFLSKLFSPVTWLFDQISRGVHVLMGRPQETPLFLSREEVRMAFEEREGTEDEFNVLVSSVFQLKSRTAGQLMIPLSQVEVFSSHALVREVREKLKERYSPILPIYRTSPQNIVSIVNVRDLIGLGDSQLASALGKSPWFVTRDTSILQLLDQFRKNNQSVAIILEPNGQASGILTLDEVLDSLFGRQQGVAKIELDLSPRIERTLPGSMKIREFNRQFDADLEGDEEMTLSEFLFSHLEHSPVRGEIVRIGSYEFTILELSLRAIRTISVRSLSE